MGIRWSTALLAATALLAVPAGASAEIAGPLPGGKYKGETKRGGTVKLDLKAASTGDELRGKLRVPCAGAQGRLTVDDDDGKFKVKKQNGRGQTLLRAKGRFSELDAARGGIKKLRGRDAGCKPGPFEAALKGPEQIETKTVRYGPYELHPSSGHGGHGGGGHENIVDRVDPPCEECFVVGMDPDLVHEDGSSANHATNAMLHHTVLFNRNDKDATCGSWQERFFASGNERTQFVLPHGYGYRIDSGDQWRALSHLVNNGHEMQRLAVEITFYVVPASANLKPVRPMWLDVNNCGNSQYTIPAGVSDTTWDFEVTPELEGALVAIGGHQHNDGVRIELTNATRGGSICSSFAGYGTDPAYKGNIESMTGCTGDPLAFLNAGDVLRLHSQYDSDTKQHDVMGIMVGYVSPQPVQ